MARKGRGGELDRGERLDALVAAIRARSGVSMQELALELGVTVRTIRRDIALLRERGMEIEGDRGRGGGIRFARYASLPPLQLDSDQAVGLWLSVQIARRVTGLPFSRGSQIAMNKVLGSLPPDRRAQLRRLCRRIVVGTGASEAMRESYNEISPMLLEIFERCFREETCLSFRYEDRNGISTQRRVEPHGIFVRLPFWYVLAVDVDKQAERMFRMDRIANPRSFARPFYPSIDVVEAQLQDVPYVLLGFPEQH